MFLSLRFGIFILNNADSGMLKSKIIFEALPDQVSLSDSSSSIYRYELRFVFIFKRLEIFNNKKRANLPSVSAALDS